MSGIFFLILIPIAITLIVIGISNSSGRRNTGGSGYSSYYYGDYSDSNSGDGFGGGFGGGDGGGCGGGE